MYKGLLSRGEKRAMVYAHPKYAINESPVPDGLSLRPRDIERLARDGIAVSTPNANQFSYDSDGNSWDMPPELARDADRNTMWEMSQRSKNRILNARRKDKAKFT